MKYLFLILMIISPLSYSCGNESKKETVLFAKVLQKDAEAIDVAILYPDVYENAEVSSVSLVVFQDDEFYMTVNLDILKSGYKLKNVKLENYSWSYIAIKESALEGIEVNVSYRWPPNEDGSFTLCGPELREQLVTLVGREQK